MTARCSHDNAHARVAIPGHIPTIGAQNGVLTRPGLMIRDKRTMPVDGPGKDKVRAHLGSPTIKRPGLPGNVHVRPAIFVKKLAPTMTLMSDTDRGAVYPGSRATRPMHGSGRASPSIRGTKKAMTCMHAHHNAIAPR